MSNISTAAALIFLLALLVTPGAQAASDTPEIPPRQECVDILAASVPKMFSTYFYDGDGHYAAYQKTVDAGCLPRNPIYYYPDWDQWMDYELCLDYERQVAAYMQGVSTWAAPFYRQLIAIDRQGKKKLRPVRRKIDALRFSKNKRQLKRLLRRERAVVRKIRNQLFALGGKTVGRGAVNFAAGAIVVGDLFVRGCEIYQPFYYRQKNYYAAFWPSVLRWMRTYRGQITERNWRDWHAMVQYNAYPSFVNINIPQRPWTPSNSGGIGPSEVSAPPTARRAAAPQLIPAITPAVLAPAILVPDQRPAASRGLFSK